MRHDTITAAALAPQALQPRIFICACCETHEHRPDEVAPAGWVIEIIDGTGYAFCGECKIDVPGRAGPLATRLGTNSPLDLAELFECDEETFRDAQRMAGLAQVERAGRIAMPILLGAICLGIAICGIAQGTKWIMM